MADLIAVVFPTEAKAEEVRDKLLGMQKDYLIELGDAVIATKTDSGKVKLNQLMNTTAAGAAGAAGRALWHPRATGGPGTGGGRGSADRGRTRGCAGTDLVRCRP